MFVFWCVCATLDNLSAWWVSSGKCTLIEIIDVFSSIDMKTSHLLKKKGKRKKRRKKKLFPQKFLMAINGIEHESENDSLYT